MGCNKGGANWELFEEIESELNHSNTGNVSHMLFFFCGGGRSRLKFVHTHSFSPDTIFIS